MVQVLFNMRTTQELVLTDKVNKRAWQGSERSKIEVCKNRVQLVGVLHVTVTRILSSGVRIFFPSNPHTHTHTSPIVPLSTLPYRMGDPSEATGQRPVAHSVGVADSDPDSSDNSTDGDSKVEQRSAQSPRINNSRTHRRQETERRRGSTRSVSPQNSRDISNGSVANNGGIRPWILLVIFSVVQWFISSTIQSNGVNASSSDQTTDAGADNGGSGNSAQGSGRSYDRHYYRQLPPITDPSRARGTIVTERMTETRRVLLRKEAKDMFLHGYHGYLNNAFPMDELNPVACTGRGPDRQNPDNINVNDVLGDFSLTLIDALDTLAVMKEPELFRQAIYLVQRHVRDFNINSRVQVFEVNIRVLGALLSGHLYASDPAMKSVVKGYKNELLIMAEDLGKRLMKAFENTPTGIPWPRVNLRKGVLRDESPETCVAGAGSLLLEFGVLSRLTGDMTYEVTKAHSGFNQRGGT